MKYSQKYMAFILVVLFVGGILYAKEYGYWQTESSKTPSTIAVGDKEVYNPEDIRGSYSFKDVSEAFDIPIEVLGEAFQLPDNIDINLFKNKDLEELYGEFVSENQEIGNGSVKTFVALYKNIPFELEDGNMILEKGSEILMNLGTLTDDQIEYLKNNTVVLNQNREALNADNVKLEADNEGEYSDEDEEHEEFKINGEITFREMEAAGMIILEIEKLLGKSIENKEIAIKDFCEQNGLSFSEIKENLIELYENKNLTTPETKITVKEVVVPVNVPTTEPTISPKSEPVATPKVESIYNDGLFTGTGVGYRSGLEVQIEIKNGKIFDINVLKEREDEEFYLDTFDIMTNQILDVQGTSNVYGISGATYTANGFKDAVNNALEKAKK